jgi:hypothetical protein
LEAPARTGKRRWSRSTEEFIQYARNEWIERVSGREQKRTSDRVERIEEEITFKKRQKGGELSAARSGDLGDQPGSNQYRLTNPS